MASTPVTLNEVAAEVGVSVSTASRALSGGKVRESTRQAVAEAAKRLGYVSPTPSQLKDGKEATGLIGLLSTDVGNYYFIETFAQIIQTAQTAGYQVLCGDINDTCEHARVLETLKARTDGQILLSPRLGPETIHANFDPRRTVITSNACEGFSSVLLDDESGMMQAVCHLASLGHRRIAYVSGSLESFSNTTRLNAFKRYCERYHTEGQVLGPYEASHEGGVNAADRLLLDDGLTAVIAYNDIVATGLTSRLLERGLTIPGDISIVGFDNSLLSKVSRPALTTVEERDDMWEVATHMLLTQLQALREEPESEFAPKTLRMAETLIVRDSTGPAPQR